MEPTDLTIEILKGIRDEIRGTNAELRSVKSELKAEIGEMKTELKGEIAGVRVEVVGLKAEIRGVKAEIGEMKTELGVAFREVKVELEVHGEAIVKVIHEMRGMNERFDNFLHGAHHEDHADLRARVGRLEAKVG